MKRSLDRQHNEQTEINVSPLIDMVFILLIFFIVATSFVNEIGISSSYKDSSSARDTDRPPLLFDLPGSGQVFLNGSPVGLEGVASQVRNALTPAPPSVIVRVSAGAKAGFATQVMDQALLAGANAVKLVAYTQ